MRKRWGRVEMKKGGDEKRMGMRKMWGRVEMKKGGDEKRAGIKKIGGDEEGVGIKQGRDEKGLG